MNELRRNEVFNELNWTVICPQEFLLDQQWDDSHTDTLLLF